MSLLKSDYLRTIAVIGPAGSGKTMLIEQLLAATGAIASAGSTERGNTVCGADPMEREYGHSLDIACCHYEQADLRVVLIDTPGYFDLMGRTLAALPAVDTVLLVLNATQTIDGVAERLWQAVHERGLDCFIVINKIDATSAQPAALLQTVQQRLGKHCLPLNLPAQNGGAVADAYFDPIDTATDFSSVSAAHNALIDQVVEVDEALMARYLEQGEQLQATQLHDAFEKALRDDHIVPVCFTSARNNIGIHLLTQIIAQLAPHPGECNPPTFYRGTDSQPLHPSLRPDDHVLAHVVKVTIDPYVGRIAWLRVHQGVLRSGSSYFIGSHKKAFKLAHLLRLQGKQTQEINAAGPGDIVAISKVDDLHYDALVHDHHDEDRFHLKAIPLPAPIFGLALKTARHGDEQKLSDVLHKLAAEDPSLRVEHRANVNETVLMGLGEFHVKVALNKMRALAQLDIETHAPSVPYRETITTGAEGFCRHKKQSGGAGQFAEVHLRIEPLPRGSGFEFVDKVVGGAIPGQYIPSIEKGVLDVLSSGAIAGFEVHDIRVTVFDGKHHPVDSKDIAFMVAGRKALLDAIDKAKAIVLEPYAELQIECAAACVGDITGELSTRRGMINGTDLSAAQQALIKALLPIAELPTFQTRLKAITGGEMRFTMSHSHYDAVPITTQQQLVGKFKRREED